MSLTSAGEPPLCPPVPARSHSLREEAKAWLDRGELEPGLAAQQCRRLSCFHILELGASSGW